MGCREGRVRTPAIILLDTHVLIWLTMEPSRLGRDAREAIRAATAARDVLFSPITAWEAARLADKGKLRLGRPVREWMERVTTLPGVRTAELSPAIAIDAGSLPRPIHGDPADRLIVATARALECPVMTADRKILDYSAAGHVHVIDARL